jgi:uncharacterized protein (DUF58 family)
MVDDKAPTGSLSIFGSSWAMFMLVILLVVASVNAATLVVRIAALVLVLMLSARLWAAVGLWRLDLELSCDGYRLFPGDSFALRFTIANRKLLPLWVRLELPVPDGLELSTASAETCSETSLHPLEQRTGVWTFRASRRGVHQLGPATLHAGDLLGLYSRDKPVSFRSMIVVYPRLVPILIPDLPFMDYFGIHPARGIVEDPAWYEGTREYSGDKPARHIHWKASARLDQLQEKIFQPTTHRRLYLILDGSDFRVPEDRSVFETAIEVAASLASLYIETGATVALATDRRVRNYPASLDLARGPEQLGRMLELLARCELEPGLQDFLSDVQGSALEGCGFIVISRSSARVTTRYFRLPGKKKDRLLFIFARNPEAGSDVDHPYLTFEELLADGRVQHEGHGVASWS